MKILLVSHYYPPHIGGIENIVQKQAQDLTARGQNITVVTFASQQEIPENIEEQGIIIHKVGAINFFEKYFNLPFPIGGIGLIWRLWKEVERNDIVHINDIFYESSWLACIFAKVKNKPLLLTQHVGIVEHPSRAVKFIEHIVYKTIGKYIFIQSKKIIVFNDNVKNFLVQQKIDQNKIIKIRNGIDLSLFYPHINKNFWRAEFNLPENRPIVLFVGRLVAKKGINIIYEARSAEYEIVFAGPGIVPKEWKSAKNIHLLGGLSQDQLARLYRASDIFVFPSNGEVFTLAIQEAMASGLPIITSDDPGYKNYNLNKKFISFIMPNAKNLREEINRILNDKTLCKQMSGYSIHLAQKMFDWNKNFDQIANLYSEINKDSSLIAVTTSWDDGHILDLRLAELLKKFSLKGTFYVSPRNVEFGAEKLLNKNAIKFLDSHFEIGAHTFTHMRLKKAEKELAWKEIQKSKKYLEELLKKPVESFCYPGGEYSRQNKIQVQENGFRLARTTKRFSFGSGKDPYEIPTSVNTYNHWLDAWRIALFARFHPLKFLHYYRNWDLLAIAMFDQVIKKGGVFHLWGHSWEIDKHNDWKKLEKVFAYISNRPNVKYINNKELL